MAAKRRIKSAKIRYLSLCPRGANGFETIYKDDKHDEERFNVGFLLKSFDKEKGELLAVVYAPEIPDSEGDVASAEVIKEAMYDAAKHGLQLDLQHDFRPLQKNQAYVAESFIVQKSDPRFSNTKDYNGKPVDVTGGWGVVIKIEDEDLRKRYSVEGWNGVSMAGTAITEPIKKERQMTPEEIAAVLKSQETKTEEKINAIVAKSLDSFADKVATLISKLVPEKKATEKVKKEFKPRTYVGDPSDFRRMQLHGLEEQLRKSAHEVDFSDADSLSEHGQLAQELTPRINTIKQELAKEEEELKKKKASAQPSTDESGESLTKEEDEMVKAMLSAGEANGSILKMTKTA